MNSVQSEAQYVFLHAVLIDYIMRRYVILLEYQLKHFSQLIDPSSAPGLAKFNGDYQLMILPKTKAKPAKRSTKNTKTV